MTFGLIAIGLALLMVPAIATYRAALCPPHEWARFTAASLLTGLLIVELGLVSTALPTALHFLDMKGIALVCDPIVHALAPQQPVIGWAALLLALGLAARAIRVGFRSWRSASKARVEPWIGDHRPVDECDLVIVPAPVPIAVAVPGGRHQVLVSDTLARALDEPAFEAVVAHELAHLRLRHRRYLVLAAVVESTFALLPQVRRSIASLRSALEQWADDHAVMESSAERREDLDRAIGAATSMFHAAGLSVADSHQRLERLRGRRDKAPALVRSLTYSPALLSTVAAIIVVAAWLQGSHHMLSIGGYCPS